MDFIVETPLFEEDDIRLFGLTDPKRLPESATMFDVLVAAGIFKSKGDARKNWKGDSAIPSGLSSFEVGKMKKEIWILKVTSEKIESKDFGRVGGATETPKPPKVKPLDLRKPTSAVEDLVVEAGKIFFKTWPNRKNFEKAFADGLGEYFVSKEKIIINKYIGWKYRKQFWKYGPKNVLRNGLRSWKTLLPFEWVNKFEVEEFDSKLKGSVIFWHTLEEIRSHGQV